MDRAHETAGAVLSVPSFSAILVPDRCVVRASVPTLSTFIGAFDDRHRAEPTSRSAIATSRRGAEWFERLFDTLVA